MRHLVLTLILAAFAAVSSPAKPPNVVLIMCDDLGWGDVGFNGGTHIRTPHLDEMAAAGLRFTRFYAQAPVCSPTRASVVTGRHHDRTGIYTANNGHLREGEFTLYEALREKGYGIGHFGKWHMGTLTRKTDDANRGGPKGVAHYSPPWHHGVDTSFATESKTPTYDPMWKPGGGKGGGRGKPSSLAKTETKEFTGPSGKGWHAIPEGAPRAAYGTHYWIGEETMVDPESESLLGDDSKVIMDRAIPFIENEVAEDRPFLAIVWFHAPHLPVVASAEDAGSYADETDSGFDQNYRGCVTAIDREVGRLRARLREIGVADNTIVTFCSDNGPEGKQGDPGKQGDYRGRKRSLYEGGVRVPGLIEWPDGIEPGVTDVTACTVDYFQTIMEVVGFEMPDDRPLDGVSLVPLFDGSGEMKVRPKPLGFHIRGQAAWHDGEFKIYRKSAKADWELYDLGADPGEASDLAASQPERTAAMAAAWEKWKASVDASDGGADY